MNETVLIAIVAVMLVVFGLLGALRDIRRAVIAIAGTLLGAILVDFWAQPWGLALARSLGSGDVATMTAIVSIVTLALTTLIVGYGGGALMPVPKEKISILARIGGALLGVLNGALVLGFVMRYVTSNNEALRASLNASWTGAVFVTGLPWLFLGIALLTGLFVIARLLLRAAGVGRKPAPVMPGSPQLPVDAATAPPSVGLPKTPAERDQSPADKVTR